MAAESRAVKKYKAILRARKRLEQRLEMIDWELDTLVPGAKEVAQLEETENIAIEVGEDAEGGDNPSA